MTNTILNGLNVDVLVDTVTAIQAQPEIGKFVFHADNRWLGGLESRTTIDGFYGVCEEHQRSEPFQIIADHPAVLQGADKAPNPMEYLLHAMAGCLTTSIMAHATARGIRVDAVESRFVGNIDLRGFLGLTDEVRCGYGSIGVEIKIEGDADAETLRDLVDYAKSRSPAFDIVTNGVPVDVTVTAQATGVMQVA